MEQMERETEKTGVAETREPKQHEIKIHPVEFSLIRSGKKKAELRLNDRDYRVGDTLVLLEFKPLRNLLTGHRERRVITAITKLSEWVPECVNNNWVILHLEWIRQ